MTMAVGITNLCFLLFAFVGMQPGNVPSVPTNVSLPTMVIGRPSQKGFAHADSGAKIEVHTSDKNKNPK